MPLTMRPTVSPAYQDLKDYTVFDEGRPIGRIYEDEIGARICVVGDDDQTIYQWRGSDVGNILTFVRRYQGVEQIPLDRRARLIRSPGGIILRVTYSRIA
jgi:superfamily I DNA/RNA helicase